MANLATVTSIVPQTHGSSLTTSLSNIVSNQSANSAVVYKITSILATNIHGTNDADVTVTYTGYYGNGTIASTVTVPADSVLVILTADTPIYLTGDGMQDAFLKASASAESHINLNVTYEIITCAS